MDCFVCVILSTSNGSLFDTNSNVLSSFMISQFLAAHAPRVQRAWNLMLNISTAWAKVRPFVWEKRLFYAEAKFS